MPTPRSIPESGGGRGTLSTDAELTAERAYTRRARARLEELISQTAGRLAETVGRSTTHMAGLDLRDALTNQAAVRLQALQAGTGPLCFGRINMTDGQTLVVGRTSVSDAELEPLVVDWRAPAAAPFYTASGPEPMGVVRRRHFLWRDDDVAALDDEVFDQGAAHATGLGLVGEAALLTALTQARRDRMGDIVATIQREQHEIIHSPLPGALIVQGGAGTGKTAIALHRAAYLLYAHRLSLETAGVLFIGPNRRFLRYIGDVLPSLGETAVHMSTAAELVDGVTATADEPAAVSGVKHDARMARVISAAIAARERPLRQPLQVPYGSRRVVVSVAVTARIIEAARTSRVAHHNERAGVVRRLLLNALRRIYILGEERRIAAGVRGGEVSEEDVVAFVEAAGRSRAVAVALARMWPVLDGEQLVGDLLGSPVLLAHAARGILSAEEIGTLGGALHRDADGLALWSVADVALIDEASHQLGPSAADTATDAAATRGRSTLTSGERFDIDQVLAEMPGLSPVVRDDIVQRLTNQALAGRGVEAGAMPRHDRWRGYGHVLVDEAQDLSPMQWRMVNRRAATNSLTIVGDLAQGTSPWSTTSWEDVAQVLGAASRTVELSVGYRTPEEVMAIAAEVIAVAHPALIPPRAVRRSGHIPEAHAVGSDALVGAALAAAARLGDLVGQGTVAVIAPTRLVDELSQASANESLVILDPIGAKGLEFDAVVMVEPAELADGPGGLAAVYIAATRVTDYLTIVHSRPLPAPVAAGL